MKSNLLLISITSIGLLSCGGNNSGSGEKDTTTTSQKVNDSTANIDVNPEKNCYFGDLHLHTALSPDANLIGATLFPEDSYKFAMGQEVTYMGQKIKRIAPLDFLAVTDHAEYLGVISQVKDPKALWAGTAT